MFLCLTSPMSYCICNYHLNCCALQHGVTWARTVSLGPACLGVPCESVARDPKTGVGRAQGLRPEMGCNSLMETDWHSEMTDGLWNALRSLSFYVSKCFERKWWWFCRCLKDPLTSRRRGMGECGVCVLGLGQPKRVFCVRVCFLRDCEDAFGDSYEKALVV